MNKTSLTNRQLEVVDILEFIIINLYTSMDIMVPPSAKMYSKYEILDIIDNVLMEKRVTQQERDLFNTLRSTMYDEIVEHIHLAKGNYDNV